MISSPSLAELMPPLVTIAGGRSDRGVTWAGPSDPDRRVAIAGRDRERRIDPSRDQDVAKDRCHAPFGIGGSGLRGGSRTNAPPHFDVIATNHDQRATTTPIVDGLFGAQEHMGLETSCDKLGVDVVRQVKERTRRRAHAIAGRRLVRGTDDGHKAFPRGWTGVDKVGRRSPRGWGAR